MKAYKALHRDLTCRKFQYKEGETYEVEGKPSLCSHGFHFCTDLVLTLAYYPVDHNITENCYAEVEVLGEVEFEEPTGHKGVTNKIKILRIIPDDEVIAMVDAKSNTGTCNSGDYNSGTCNSGDYNSGNRNSGDYNSGDYNSGNRNSGYNNSGDNNSGDYNSGDRNSGTCNSGYNNSGNRNSGDWNACDRETGFFNTKEPETINVFNKPCSLEEWRSTYKPAFLYFEPDPATDYKASFQKSWRAANVEDRERIRELPNFDADVFYELSGIDLRESPKVNPAEGDE